MRPTAYISAEIGFATDVPTYSGGLGVLAGDHLKSAADLSLPLVGVTLLYREGYFVQRLDAHGHQSASYPRFHPENLMERTGQVVSIKLGGRTVELDVWRAEITGRSGHVVPVLLLDADVESNHPDDRSLTHRLYGGDHTTRLRQETALGFGGAAAVRALYPHIEAYHLNEGHCAFLPLALLRDGMSVQEVRRRCHFTTHTPVPAGHDHFPYDLAYQQIGDYLENLSPGIEELAGTDDLSMSHLALALCGTANGVSELHGQVSRQMFPNHDIGHITNGVHHLSWISEPIAALYDEAIPGWREEPRRLSEGASTLPADDLWRAHTARKRQLLEYVNGETQLGFGSQLLTIGFARRAAAYKRAALLFSDPERLAAICQGKVQFVFAGKAHPRDTAGQEVIETVFRKAHQLHDRLRICYLENYNMWTGALITSGVDVWLNNPRRPREASGTSGMKAVLNGVPNLSIADGWWAEGARDNVNGWVIGGTEADDAKDAEDLYQTLEQRVLPAWEDRARWTEMMRAAIATGADFTAERMVLDYKQRYYR